MGQWWNQKEKLKYTLRQMTMKTQPYKIYGVQQKKFLEGSSQGNRPPSKKKKKEGKRKNLKQPTLLLKKLQKEQTKPKVTGRKEIIKIGEEINRD